MPYDLKSDATSNQIRLSRKKVIKKTFKANVILSGIAVLMLIVYFMSPSIMSQTLLFIGVSNEAIVLFILFALIFIVISINIFYNYLYYKTYYYNIKEDLLVIRKGLFLPDEISIPYNRIQDIYVDRDTLDLILGLYDVHVSSATTESGKDAHIDGVTYANAVKLKEMILEKVKASSKGSPL
jgi:membrane protein YdbS with pleckstrin-like domain